jgi:hypothetical protein
MQPGVGEQKKYLEAPIGAAYSERKEGRTYGASNIYEMRPNPVLHSLSRICTGLKRATALRLRAPILTGLRNQYVFTRDSVQELECEV